MVISTSPRVRKSASFLARIGKRSRGATGKRPHLYQRKEDVFVFMKNAREFRIQGPHVAGRGTYSRGFRQSLCALVTDSDSGVRSVCANGGCAYTQQQGLQ